MANQVPDRGSHPKRKVTYLGVAYPEGSEGATPGGYIEKLDNVLRQRPGTRVASYVAGNRLNGGHDSIKRKSY